MGSIRTAWWNLENLFNTVDDPISADLEFTPENGWTDEAYAAKKKNLAAALNELFDGERRFRIPLPDLFTNGVGRVRHARSSFSSARPATRARASSFSE